MGQALLSQPQTSGQLHCGLSFEAQVLAGDCFKKNKRRIFQNWNGWPSQYDHTAVLLCFILCACRTGMTRISPKCSGSLASSSPKPSSRGHCRTLPGNTEFPLTCWALLLRSDNIHILKSPLSRLLRPQDCAVVYFSGSPYRWLRRVSWGWCLHSRVVSGWSPLV